MFFRIRKDVRTVKLSRKSVGLIMDALDFFYSACSLDLIRSPDDEKLINQMVQIGEARRLLSALVPNHSAFFELEK